MNVNNPEDVKLLKETLDQLAHAFARIDQNRTEIKDTLTEVASQLDIDKKLLRKVSVCYYKQNFLDDLRFSKDFENIFETVIGTAED